MWTVLFCLCHLLNIHAKASRYLMIFHRDDRLIFYQRQPTTSSRNIFNDWKCSNHDGIKSHKCEFFWQTFQLVQHNFGFVALVFVFEFQFQFEFAQWNAIRKFGLKAREKAAKNSFESKLWTTNIWLVIFDLFEIKVRGKRCGTWRRRKGGVR